MGLGTLGLVLPQLPSKAVRNKEKDRIVIMVMRVPNTKGLDSLAEFVE
jgi:hypothetical protein